MATYQPVDLKEGAMMSAEEQIAALSLQNQQLEQLIHALPDMVIGIAAAGHITLLNDAVWSYLGVAPQPLPQWSLVDLAQYDAVFEEVADHFAGSDGVSPLKPFEARSEAHKRDFTVTITRGSDDQWVLVLHDISAQRDLMRFKNEVLKLASHDLRSPLALVIGYASLIPMELPPNSPAADYVASILSATERMTGLLDAMIIVEQVRNAPLELDRFVIFGDLVAEVVARMEPQAAQNHQQIIVEIALDTMPPMTLHRPYIIDVIENLLSNAIKYSPEDRPIVLRAWHDVEQGRVVVTVRDQGAGITSEEFSRIFEAFYRGKQPNGRRNDGRGLGLWLVKTIVQRHQGDVWIESQINDGSLFGFWLPVS